MGCDIGSAVLHSLPGANGFVTIISWQDAYLVKQVPNLETGNEGGLAPAVCTGEDVDFGVSLACSP